MSIASAITAAQGRVADAYTAISNKGGTLPATQNLSNMPTAISSIPSGGTIDSLTITPTTSEQTITASGGVDGYSPITVNAVTSSIDANIQAGNIKDGVSILGVTGTMQSGYTELPSYKVSSGVASRRSGALTGTEFSNITSIGTYGMQYAFYSCSGLTGSIDLSALTAVGNYGMQYAFYYCTGLTSLDLSALASVDSYGMSNAFYYCSGLTGSIDLSSLTSVAVNGMANAFYGCSGLTSVDLSSVTSIDSYGMFYAFYNCTGLTSVDLSSVTSVASYGMNRVFSYCIRLTSVSLSALTSVDLNSMSYAFSSCRGLTDIYFNSLKTTSFVGSGAFSNMFDSNTASTSGTCTVHFPSNLQSTISGLTGYPTFGGNSSRIVLSFDLPATS